MKSILNLNLELENKNGISTISMYCVGFLNDSNKIEYTPYFTSKKAAIDHYKSMCNLKIYNYDEHYCMHKKSLFF